MQNMLGVTTKETAVSIGQKFLELGLIIGVKVA